MNKFTAYLIDPEKKTVLAVEADDDSIATFLGCDIICLGATFPSGDVLYVNDENSLSSCLAGFTIEEAGYMYGVGLFAGSDKAGVSKAPEMSLGEVSAMVRFEKDPTLEWFENYLTRNGINKEMLLPMGEGDTEKMVTIGSIINILSTLPESKKSEIKMMVMLDETSHHQPLRFLKYIAEKMELK